MNEVLRSSFLVVAELQLITEPTFEGWSEGPLPLAWRGEIGESPLRMDAEQRQQYFSPRVKRRLYPGDRRFWKQCSYKSQGMTKVKFIEALFVPEEYEAGPRIFVVLHGSGPTQPVFPLMAEIRKWSDELVDVTSAELDKDVLSSESGEGVRRFSQIFAAMSESRLSVFDCEDDWGVPMQTAWVLAQKWLGAVVSSPTASHLRHVRDTGGMIEASNEVSVVLVPDGAGVVAVGAGINADPFDDWIINQPPKSVTLGGYTQLMVHTIYADCFLMALQQSSGLNEIADRFGVISGDVPRLADLRNLERWFAVFRSEVWWHQITELSEANELLRAFQRQHDLDDLMEEVGRDLGYLSDQIQTQNTVISSVAISLLTLILFPLTVTIAAVEALVPSRADAIQKLLAFLASIPIALLVGIGIAACIPRYMRFVVDAFRRRT